MNLLKELEKTKQSHENLQRSLMREVNNLISKGQKADEYLLKRLSKAPQPGTFAINSDLLDKSKIFSLDDIRIVSINYRLRFLDSKHFKMEELPYDALIALKNFETIAGVEVKRFKLLASGKYFKLEDRNKDPMLFAQIDEHNFYLLHKWGKDFQWYKKWLVYPLRSIGSLFINMVTLGVPLALILPEFMFHNPADIRQYRTLFLAFVTIYTLFTLVFGGFTFYKKFSRVSWNSPYFN
jgi:hypothetical protein